MTSTSRRTFCLQSLAAGLSAVTLLSGCAVTPQNARVWRGRFSLRITAADGRLEIKPDALNLRKRLNFCGLISLRRSLAFSLALKKQAAAPPSRAAFLNPLSHVPTSMHCSLNYSLHTPRSARSPIYSNRLLQQRCQSTGLGALKFFRDSPTDRLSD